ncbi:hypothetical protein B0H14DRAFT_2583203 [Mycena olivaceomarginata]|nr:hypothetical protein B0H14DRAFT_2583203 [Mycena olivaceomarginata]
MWGSWSIYYLSASFGRIPVPILHSLRIRSGVAIPIWVLDLDVARGALAVLLPLDAPFNINICGCMANLCGQRDFAAAVLLPHAAAAAAALQRQSAVIVLAAHVELLGITVNSGFKGVEALYCN